MVHLKRSWLRDCMVAPFTPLLDRIAFCRTETRLSIPKHTFVSYLMFLMSWWGRKVIPHLSIPWFRSFYGYFGFLHRHTSDITSSWFRSCVMIYSKLFRTQHPWITRSFHVLERLRVLRALFGLFDASARIDAQVPIRSNIVRTRLAHWVSVQKGSLLPLIISFRLQDPC